MTLKGNELQYAVLTYEPSNSIDLGMIMISSNGKYRINLVFDEYDGACSRDVRTIILIHI